jgi:hypothetical protein
MALGGDGIGQAAARRQALGWDVGREKGRRGLAPAQTDALVRPVALFRCQGELRFTQVPGGGGSTLQPH